MSIKNQFNNLSKNQPEKTLESNKIPIIENTDPNPRFIETDFSKVPDNLPSLEPVRTLETDSENRDDIITSKLSGSEIKKPETEIEKEVSKLIPRTLQKEEIAITEKIEILQKKEIESEEVSEIPQKTKDVDPYRESF